MILTILGLIGRILLIILLVIVALVLVILFVPVLYRAEADSELKMAAARIAVLFGLLRFKASWEDRDTQLGLYLLWFRLPVFQKKDGEKEAEPEEGAGEPKKASAVERITERIPFLSKKKEEHQKTAEARPKRKPRRKIPPELEEEEEARREAEREAEEERREAEREAKEAKRERILRVVEYFFDREIFDAIFLPLQRLLIRIRPRKARGEAEFGLSDPSYTGYLCGLLAAIPFLYGTDLEILPDFEAEESYFRGNIWLRGRILTIFVLIFILRLLLNKDVRRFFGMVRKLIKGDKKHG